jgi:hypothetical protein
MVTMPSTLSDPDRQRLYRVLAERLPTLSPGATLDAERDEVVIPLGDSRARVSTDTLLSGCAGQPKRRWPSVVETWLAGLSRQLTDAAADPGPDPARLRVQALPRAAEPPAGVSAGFNSSFDLLVVEDRPEAARRLLAPDLDALGMTADQAVRAGLDLTISEVLVRLDVQNHTLPGGGEIRMASAEGVPYVSAGITSVRQLAGVDSPYGTLVGVPRHSMIVLQPVTSRAVLDGLGVLTGLVGSMYDGSPDACARGVYWFASGDAFPVGVETEPGGRPQLTLPAELADVVASLPA